MPVYVNTSVKTCPEVILSRAPPVSGDPASVKHLICVGSSIIKQTIPYLNALGYSITDLSQPGWLATQENVDALISELSHLNAPPGFALVMDLLSICGHRFEQFDGTQAMAQKEGGKYHMKGPVQVCEDQTFKKIIDRLGPILLSAQDSVKVSVPPLPRYLFNSCCNNPQHCSNLLNEDHVEKMLNGVSHLRAVFKAESIKKGVRNHWILDGAGTMAGIEVGSSGGSNRELIPEMRQAVAVDSVHLSPEGYRRLAKAIVTAVVGIREGRLTKSFANASSVTGGHQSPKLDFFWRGFSSPVGDAIGRAAANRNPRQQGCRGWRPHYPHYYHPYKKNQ
jgi:hypothetical protein